MIDPTAFQTLPAFRAEAYTCLSARRDALFEALDAATTVGPVPSLPYLSLTALHRRRWGSLYAALAEGSMDVSALPTLVGRHRGIRPARRSPDFRMDLLRIAKLPGPFRTGRLLMG